MSRSQGTRAPERPRSRERSRPLWQLGAFWLLVVAMAASLIAVATVVDLTPQVSPDFFFSSDDPQLQVSSEIQRLFPARSQLLVSAAGDPGSESYLERLQGLTEALGEVPGVASIRSLTRGPSSPADAVVSPLWRRLLLGEGSQASLLVLGVEEESAGAMVEEVESILEERSGPGFELAVSGVPYVVELVRRHLLRDLRTFSLAALLVFGSLVAALYRSLRVVLGSLIACVGAALLTLTLLHLAGRPIGLLTANIATIVFVLTLSHLIFLTARHRRSGWVEEAVRTTVGASFWCMVTSLLGFLSLLTASARPLAELGQAGALGTVVAFLVAYGVYPVFLRGVPEPAQSRRRLPLAALGTAGGRWPLVALGLLVALATFGLSRLSTDPSLLDYFAGGSEIRAGLEGIDALGGSSPLLLVVEDPGGERLDTDAAAKRLAALQEDLESEPGVGTCLSLPVLLAEAGRNPLAWMFGRSQLLEILEGPAFDQVARSFVTGDRTRALFFLRMREQGRSEPRRRVVERLVAKVAAQDLAAPLVGGLYDLQGKLGELVLASLWKGLGGLLIAFLAIALWVARSPRTASAMVLSLAAVPVLLLGSFGLAAVPMDVITSPAANVALGLGIDSMIHLVSAVRRRGRGAFPAVWGAALEEMGRPILGAALILAAGFGIFGLSSFPPTQRFGAAVALGTLGAALMALVALPRLGAMRGSEAESSASGLGS